MDILTNILNKNSDEIALEDGEIEEEEVVVIETVVCADNSPEVIETEPCNDNGSDVDMFDRNSNKSKKHKHHKKSIHRKRQLSGDDLNSSESWKKSKNGDEINENSPKNDNIDNDCNTIDSEPIFKEKSVEKSRWAGDSDSDGGEGSKNSDKGFKNRENEGFSAEKIDKSPLGGDRGFISDSEGRQAEIFVGSPVAKEKWGCDSDEDDSKPSVSDNSKAAGENNWTNNSSWGNKEDNSKGWDNKNEDNKGWGDKNDEGKGWGNKNNNNNSWNNKNEDDNKGWGNKNEEKKVWGNNSDEDKGWGNKNSNNNSWKNKNDDDNKGWGNKNDDDKGWGNKNDDDKGWGNKNNNNSWNNKNDDDNKGWGSKGDDDSGNKGWGNRNDSGTRSYGDRNEGNSSWGNRRGGRNNWSDRNEDRGGFRPRGRGNWRNRNDDGNSRGYRSRGGDDWNSRSRDNDSWGNKNNDNDSWKNKSNDNNSWGNKNNDNDSWGNKNNDNDSWKNKSNDNDSWGNKNNNNSWGNKDDDKQEDKEPWKPSSDSKEERKEEEVVEKSAWGHTSDSDDDNNQTASKNTVKRVDTFVSESRKDSFVTNDEVKTTEKPREVTPCKWGDFDSDDDTKKPKEDASFSKSNHFSSSNNDEEVPVAEKSCPEPANKWDYDSDDEGNTKKPTSFKPQSSFNDDDGGFKDSTPKKWGSDSFSSDNKFDQGRSNSNKWGNGNSDDESAGQSNDYGNKSFDQRNNRNNNFNRNDSFNRNDNNNGRGRGGGGRGGGGAGGKRWPCKYFQKGSCNHGDSCNFIHESPVKNQVPTNSEPKIQELCRFYEHQECYKRSACTFMHEEFPCKLFHAGSKMCPSGDSCKYSHAPLNPETRMMLEKYLDEKIDERTDKSASGSINDNSDYKAGVIGNGPPCNDDMMRGDPYFQDAMQRMYPPVPDMMKMPIRPWNPMMPYGDMPLVPPQMDFMQRQRFMFERFPQQMPGRMVQRGYRGMPAPMHDPYNGTPYAIPPMMPGYGNKGMPEMADRLNGPDPYIDNLAQIVVGPKDASTKREMMDQNMTGDELEDFPIKKENSDSLKKRSMLSPVRMNSPEAYVPRNNSMSAVQPNVRLGSGLPYGNEAAMMYGGYGGHPNDSAMMDYINLAAIHYYHNQNEAMVNYDRPWKLYILDVPCKIPYPLMNIDTQELPHKYTDPRLKGHPSVLNITTNSGGCTGSDGRQHSSGSFSDDGTVTAMLHRENSDFNQSTISSQLSSLSPMDFGGGGGGGDLERQLSSSFPFRSTEMGSPLFPVTEEAFSFLGSEDLMAKRVSDRSYLQDPRFKRKKVSVVAVASEQQAEME